MSNIAFHDFYDMLAVNGFSTHHLVQTFDDNDRLSCSLVSDNVVVNYRDDDSTVYIALNPYVVYRFEHVFGNLVKKYFKSIGDVHEDKIGGNTIEFIAKLISMYYFADADSEEEPVLMGGYGPVRFTMFGVEVTDNDGNPLETVHDINKHISQDSMNEINDYIEMLNEFANRTDEELMELIAPLVSDNECENESEEDPDYEGDEDLINAFKAYDDLSFEKKQEFMAEILTN